MPRIRALIYSQGFSYVLLMRSACGMEGSLLMSFDSLSASLQLSSHLRKLGTESLRHSRQGHHGEPLKNPPLLGTHYGPPLGLFVFALLVSAEDVVLLKTVFVYSALLPLLCNIQSLCPGQSRLVLRKRGGNLWAGSHSVEALPSMNCLSHRLGGSEPGKDSSCRASALFLRLVSCQRSQKSRCWLSCPLVASRGGRLRKRSQVCNLTAMWGMQPSAPLPTHFFWHSLWILCLLLWSPLTLPRPPFLSSSHLESFH